MSNYAISLKRTGLLLAALAFTALLLVVNFASFFGSANAQTITARSLTLSSTLPGNEAVGAAGSETNGARATHSFAFTLPTTTSIESILLRYCTDPLNATCTAPTGLDLTDAINPAGIVSSSFTNAALGTVSDNTMEINFDAFVAGGAVTLVIDDVVNPTSLGTFFVRISTHSDDNPDYPTDLVDDGAVASSITEGIEITARVKETLGFSTTGAVAEGGGNGVVDPSTNCSPLTGSGAITLGDPVENALSLQATYYNYSAFRTYTNALNGLIIQYEGSTLTSGSNNIDAAGGTATPFALGTERFGLGADGVVGGQTDQPVNSFAAGTDADFTYADNTADWAGGAGELTIEANYQGGDVATNELAFVADTATTIASSGSYVDCTTVPVRYAANIEPLTAPGVYTTTIVFSAVPTY